MTKFRVEIPQLDKSTGFGKLAFHWVEIYPLLELPNLSTAGVGKIFLLPSEVYVGKGWSQRENMKGISLCRRFDQATLA